MITSKEIFTLTAILGRIVLLIASLICLIVLHTKSKDAKDSRLSRIMTDIVFVFNIVIAYIFGDLCICGYPMLTIGAFIAIPIVIAFNWIYLFKNIKSIEAKEMYRIFIMLFIEAILIIILGFITPDMHHDIKSIN